MINANECFLGYKIDFDRLLKYGFVVEKGKYVFSKIIDTNLVLKIEIEKNGDVLFTVWDNDFDDDCISFNTSLVITKLWNDVFDDIKQKCCYKQKYKTEQANLVDRFIKNTFDVDAEFLWADTPENGVYRNKRNKKWFGIILDVDYSKLDKSKIGKVCLIDIKSNDIENLLSHQGFYPAYHMNKKNWITVVLDDTVNIDKICDLIKISYDIVNLK